MKKVTEFLMPKFGAIKNRKKEKALVVRFGSGPFKHPYNSFQTAMAAEKVYSKRYNDR